MHPRFARNVERLMPLFDKLNAMKPTFMSEIPVRPKLSGVYLFSEGKVHWYIGRSRNIRNRLAQHRGLKADDNQASFAFLLAREEAQFMRGQHYPEGTHGDPEVQELFRRREEAYRCHGLSRRMTRCPRRFLK